MQLVRNTFIYFYLFKTCHLPAFKRSGTTNRLRCGAKELLGVRQNTHHPKEGGRHGRQQALSRKRPEGGERAREPGYLMV